MSTTPPTVKDRATLLQEWVRRLIAYDAAVSWFGSSSIARGWGNATASLVANSYLLYVALLRRFTLIASAGDFLADLAAEHGTEKLGTERAKVLVVFVPVTTVVTAVTTAATSKLEVVDSSTFQVGDEPRIRSGDGSVTEVTGAIIAITTATGPHGGDEIEVPLLVGVYDPTTDTDVELIFRAAIGADAVLNTSVGATFATLDAVTTGELNPVLAGESTALALATKTWCEATTAGALGNVDPLTVSALAVPVRGVLTVYNPERGSGGADVEDDLALKYRAMHAATLANQETLAWLETLCNAGNSEVLRAIRTTPDVRGTLAIKVLRRNAAVFTAAELTALEAYCAERVRSYMDVAITNVTLTAVEIDATVTLDPDATLRAVWLAAAASLATLLDFRKWDWGGTVAAADLLAVVDQTAGVASLDIGTFLPAVDVVVGAESLPVLVRLSIKDATSGDTLNATLSASFGSS